MSRIRLAVIAGGLAVAMTAASATTTFAQQGRGGRGNRDGGRGGPGGPGGPGGFGGFGGFGSFGGPGGSILNLAGVEPVQKEVKITDAQKTKVAKLTSDLNSKRREFMDNIRRQMEAARNQLQAEQSQITNNLGQNQPLDPRDQALTGVQGTGGGFGVNPFDGGQPNVDPNAIRQGFRQQQNAARNQGFQMMRQGSEEFEKNSEQSLARILDKDQMRRLYEIQLQLEGPFAVLKPDMAERLELREEQADEIRQVQSAAGEERRRIMSQNFEMFRAMRQEQAGDNAAPNGRQANNNGNGRRARGNNGGQGGPGGNRRPRFDPEAMRKFMERPEVKARMEETRKQEDTLTERSYALVYKSLDKPQVSAFKRMLGEPFDVNQVRQAMMRGGPGGFGFGAPGGPRNAANAPANGNPPAGDAASNAPPAAKADGAKDATASVETKSAAPKAEAPKPSSGIKSTRGRR